MAKDFISPNTRCRFCGKDAPMVDYKDVNVLQKFASPQGKMYERKRSGLCARDQRRLAKAIKRARFLALMRYTG